MNDIGTIIERELRNKIKDSLDRVGILYRIFSRCKRMDSTLEKIKKKNYKKKKKKLQDYIGIRITTYFSDDIQLVIKILEKTFTLDNKQIDLPEGEYFGPVRTNLVFEIPEDWKKDFDDHYSKQSQLIDHTFEVQIRTVLSEGWHEIDHDLRYKCMEDWDGQADLSRHLNGIYATLETSDTSLLDLFNKLAFRNYREKNWNALIRNKFRLRLQPDPISEELTKLFNTRNIIAKKIYKIERTTLLEKIFSSGINIPKTPNNLVFLINEFYLKNDTISRYTPSFLKKKINTHLIGPH